MWNFYKIRKFLRKGKELLSAIDLIVDKFYTSLKKIGEILQILGADEDVRVGECGVEEEGGGVGGGEKV